MLEEDIELEINPKPINETESRQLALLLNLLKNRNGLNFKKIRKLMSEFYHNENIESDYKKLHRDIDALRDLGFNIRLLKSFLVNEMSDSYIYKLDSSLDDTKIAFTNEELLQISYSIVSQYDNFQSFHLITAAQKLFSTDLDIFPNLFQYVDKAKNKETLSQDDVLSKLVKAVKDKNPLKIQYYKNLPNKFEYREIEPYRLLKRNSVDSYLLAFDRKRNAIRKFLVPKILKVTELNGNFVSNVKINENLENYHPLNFGIHEKETIVLQCEPNSIWKFEKFLYPHPFQKKENTIELTTTNRFALYQFMHLENGVIVKTNSKNLIRGFMDYISKIKSYYINDSKL